MILRTFRLGLELLQDATSCTVQVFHRPLNNSGGRPGPRQPAACARNRLLTRGCRIWMDLVMLGRDVRNSTDPHL
jgi:hypothetical protein